MTSGNAFLMPTGEDQCQFPGTSARHGIITTPRRLLDCAEGQQSIAGNTQCDVRGLLSVIFAVIFAASLGYVQVTTAPEWPCPWQSVKK
jgi:hypothetical protein